jgi:hypothetical protein
MAVSRARAVAGVGAAVVLALLPVVAASLSPWAPLAGALVLGLLPSLNAAPSGPRAMAAATVASAVAAVAAVLASAAGPLLPIVGTALVFGLGLAVGSLAPHGLHPAGAATITLVAYLLVDPAQIVRLLDARHPLWLVALFVGAVVLAVCAWAILVVHVALRGVALPSPAVVVNLPYGLLLGALCGLFTLVCLVWFPGTKAWWAVMTVALILQPDRRGTGDRLGGRVWGTVVGGTAAALVALVVPWPAALTIVAVVAALVGALLLLAGAAYWQAAAATTVGVVLLTFERDAVIAGDLQRVVITLIAAVVTATVVALSARLVRT